MIVSDGRKDEGKVLGSIAVQRDLDYCLVIILELRVELRITKTELGSSNLTEDLNLGFAPPNVGNGNGDVALPFAFGGGLGLFRRVGGGDLHSE